MKNCSRVYDPSTFKRPPPPIHLPDKAISEDGGLCLSGTLCPLGGWLNSLSRGWKGTASVT